MNQSNTTHRADALTNALSAAYSSTSAAGLVITAVVIVAILRSSRLRQDTYFICALAMASADIPCLLIVLLYQVPSMMVGEPLGPPEVTIVVAAFLNICWYATSLILVLTAFDRYTKLVSVKWRHLFNKSRIRCSVVAVWVLAALAGVPSFMPCCTSFLFVDEFSWNYDTQHLRGAQILNTFDVALTLSSTILVYILSVAVLRMIHKRNQERIATIRSFTARRQQQREINVFFQFFTVGICMGVTEVFWNLLPLVSTNVAITVSGQLIYIACRSAHPIVLLLANSHMRTAVKEMRSAMCCDNKIASIEMQSIWAAYRPETHQHSDLPMRA